MKHFMPTVLILCKLFPFPKNNNDNVYTLSNSIPGEKSQLLIHSLYYDKEYWNLESVWGMK